MPLSPKPSAAPRIRSALKLYRVTSIITGTFLLFLCVEVILKFIFNIELQLGGSGFFAQRDTVTGFNLSTAILIVHGWFYVLYLFSDFRLWSVMRWTFPRFLLIALGGVIPFLSFFLERRIHADAMAVLDSFDQTEPAEASH